MTSPSEQAGRPSHPNCQLLVPPFYQCCCTCKFRVKAIKRRQPWWIWRITDPITRFFKFPRLSLHYKKTSFVCVGYDLSQVELNWPEHSCGCEMHTVKSKEDQS